METYVAIADLSTLFSVQLTSSGYIAPGLAMFVCKNYTPGPKVSASGDTDSMKIWTENTSVIVIV